MTTGYLICPDGQKGAAKWKSKLYGHLKAFVGLAIRIQSNAKIGESRLAHANQSNH